jgi:ribosome maturation factor RimP
LSQSAIDMQDDRLIRETGLDARVAAIVYPVIAGLGFRLVRVNISGLNGLTLQIMAERPDGTIDVEGCEAISKAVSPVLEVEDPVSRAYHLEVSSPGIDRPLVRKSDFALWAGHVMKVDTLVPVEGRRKFKGKTIEATEDGFVFENDMVAYGEERIVRIPYEAISEARLVLTDELIREALRKDKVLREANGIEDDIDDEDAAIAAKGR